MPKSEVYSWRISPEMKRALEALARIEGRSVGALLDHVVSGWIHERGRNGAADDRAQARLHAGAARTFGRIRGRDPHRSTRVQSMVRARLARKRAG